MNFSEANNPTPASSNAALERLEQSYRSLRKLFNITLAALLILSGSLFVFFLREVSLANRQITELTQFVIDYERSSVPLMDSFHAKLVEFAKANPDFGAIMAKYYSPSGGLTNRMAPGQGGPVGVPPLTNPALGK